MARRLTSCWEEGIVIYYKHTLSLCMSIIIFVLFLIHLSFHYILLCEAWPSEFNTVPVIFTGKCEQYLRYPLAEYKQKRKGVLVSTMALSLGCVGMLRYLTVFLTKLVKI